MPTNQSSGFYDHQRIPPVKEASEPAKYKTLGSCRWFGLLLAVWEASTNTYYFLKQGQLFSQEQVFGGQPGATAEKSGTQVDAVKTKPVVRQ